MIQRLSARFNASFILIFQTFYHRIVPETLTTHPWATIFAVKFIFCSGVAQ